MYRQTDSIPFCACYLQRIEIVGEPLCFHAFAYMDDGTNKDIVFKLTYDSRFDWGYWTRGITRGAGSDSTKVKASGIFAK